MTYAEVKASQALHQDREILLNFLYEILEAAKINHQSFLVKKCHTVLGQMTNKVFFVHAQREAHSSL